MNIVLLHARKSSWVATGVALVHPTPCSHKLNSSWPPQAKLTRHNYLPQAEQICGPPIAVMCWTDASADNSGMGTVLSLATMD